MNTCLIFDLDGTLVDSLPGIAASLNRTLVAHGLPAHSDAAIRSFVGDGLTTLVLRAAPAAVNPALLASLIALFKKDYELSWNQGTRIYPGMLATLDELQRNGRRLAVLSNKPDAFAVAMVRSMFPTIHFAKVLGQQESRPPKPHPHGALQIAADLGVAPAACVIIGDSVIDLETAAHAGMRAIACSWGYHDRQRLLDSGLARLIDDPAELVGRLAELAAETAAGNPHA